MALSKFKEKVRCMQKPRKLAFVIVSIVLQLIIFSATLSEAVTYYRYGVFVKDSSGNALPYPTVPLSEIKKGLQVSVHNGLESEDNFLLMCVLNGNALRFSTEKYSNVKQAFYNVNALEIVHINLNVVIDRIDENEDNVLQIITIGILDKIPADPKYSIWGFTHTVSLKLDIEGYTGITEKINKSIPTMPLDEEIAGNSVRILLNSLPGSNRAETIQYVKNKKIDIPIVVNAQNDLSVFLFVNHKYVDIDGKDSFIVKGGTKKMLVKRIKIDLKNKVNQVYALCLPTQANVPAVFSTSDKLLIFLNGD